MLTLAPERYTAGFCMVAKVILWCIWNYCIADSIDLHNARAVNFLRKPSKNMSKYYFSKCYIFLSKKFRIEKYWVCIIMQNRRRPQKQWWPSKNTVYWFLKQVDQGTPILKLNLYISFLQISLKLHLLPQNVFDKYLYIAWKHIS